MYFINRKIYIIEITIVNIMTTTIQISNEVKEELIKLKGESQTYDDVLRNLIKKNNKQIVAEEMIEYSKKYLNENLEEVKDWEVTETKW